MPEPVPEPEPDPMLDAITILFIEWQERELLQDDFSAEQLAWEFLAPLEHLMSTLWHHEQDEVRVRQGVGMAWRHTAYFITRNTLGHTGGDGA